MNCRQYRRAWDDRLDASAEARRHAASCPRCARLALGYRVLRQAIDATPRPIAPADFCDRVLAARSQARASGWPHRPVLAWAAPAAAIAATILIAFSLAHPSARRGEPARVAVGGDSTTLAFAVSRATSAGLDLAREASAPAARVGRDVLDSSREDEVPAADPAESDPAGDVLHSVGRRLGEEVRPLSGSARKAFSFLSIPSRGAGR